MADRQLSDSKVFRSRVSARNNLIGLIGHSMADQAIGQLATGSQVRVANLSANAFAFWTGALSEGRYVFPEECKFAVSGTKIADIRNTTLTAATNPSGFGVGKTQLQAAIDCPASTIIIFTGHNDWVNSTTIASAIADMLFIIQSLINAGKRVVLFTETASGSATFTTPRITNAVNLAARFAMRAWMLNLAASFAPGVLAVADTLRVMVDRASTTAGDVISSRTQDGVHPSVSGAYYMAIECLKALNSLNIPFIGPNTHLSGELYSAANNPRGNLFGTAGNFADAGTAWSQAANGGVSYAGVKPAGVPGTFAYPNSNLQAGTSIVCTGAMVTINGERFWELAITGTTAAGDNPQLALAMPGIAIANFADGDVSAYFGEFQIDNLPGGNPSTGLNSVNLNGYRTFSGPQYDAIGMGASQQLTGGTLDEVLAARSGPIKGTFNGDVRFNWKNVAGAIPDTQPVTSNITIGLNKSQTINQKLRFRDIAHRKVPAIPALAA